MGGAVGMAESKCEKLVCDAVREPTPRAVLFGRIRETVGAGRLVLSSAFFSGAAVIRSKTL
jgi:hypothetical protein